MHGCVTLLGVDVATRGSLARREFEESYSLAIALFLEVDARWFSIRRNAHEPHSDPKKVAFLVDAGAALVAALYEGGAAATSRPREVLEDGVERGDLVHEAESYRITR